MRTSGRRFPQLKESVSSASAPQLIFECGQRATSQQSNHTDLTSELPGGLLMIISRYESEPVLPSARVRCPESSLLADAEQLPALDPPLRVILAATHLERYHAAQNRDEHELTAQRRPPWSHAEIVDVRASTVQFTHHQISCGHLLSIEWSLRATDGP